MWQIYIYIHWSNSSASGSGIYKANIYHNDCYLGLFVFKFLMNNSSLFWNKRNENENFLNENQERFSKTFWFHLHTVTENGLS